MKRRRSPPFRLLALEHRIVPALFTVTNTTTSNTAGSGSFRRAITDANASPGLDTIQFNIPGAGVHTINGNITLTVSEPLIIDGWSQPGFTTTPLIEFSATGGENQGIVVTGGGTTIQGLIINSFQDEAIMLNGGANNLVRGCWIGTDKTGLLDDGNEFGISIRDSASATIGGTTAKDRNVISGSKFDNIRVWGPNSDGTKIIGCYIGTDITGNKVIGGVTGGGTVNGIWLGDTTPNTDGSPDHITVGGLTAGERNVIAGMSANGIIATFATSDHLIQGNYIGVGADGKTLVANTWGVVVEQDSSKVTIDRNLFAGTSYLGANDIYGQAIILGGVNESASDNVVTGNTIGLTADGLTLLGQFDHGVVVFEAKNNRVGGLTAAERNVIANCYFDNVGIYGAKSTGNLVQGNYIGTDITGAKGIGTTQRGVWLGDNFPPSVGGASGNTIGGTAAGAANVIGNCTVGVLLTVSAHDNFVQGNFIGTDKTGTVNLGNYWGVMVEINATNNTIGGTAPGAGNVIANSTDDGVLVGRTPFSGLAQFAGPGNRVSGNSIRNNGGLGIDLGLNDGVSANDNLDADTGPNLMQNYPVIVSAKSGATTSISGVLKSKASTTYTLEFFANSTLHPSGFGEGGRYLGATTITTDGTGRGEFIDKSIAAATVSGEYITATATDAAGNTSEFSNGILVNVLPKVTSLVINNGNAQRSRVTTMTINFNQFVTLPATPADAFTLKRQSDSLTVGLSATKVNDLFTSVSFTFVSGPIESAFSLADGRYTLTASAALIGNLNGALDGNDDGIAGGTYVHTGTPGVTPGLFRRFGDSNGTGTVDLTDFAALRAAFGLGPNTIFDFEQDNDVDLADFSQFRVRFNIPI